MKTPSLLVLLFLLSISASAVECPPGFEWQRMSGVGCVQSDCNTRPHAHWSYTRACICSSMDNIDDPEEDKYSNPCYRSVDYESFDRSKCGAFCPSSYLEECILPDQLCPGETTTTTASTSTTTTTTTVTELASSPDTSLGRVLSPEELSAMWDEYIEDERVCNRWCRSMWGSHAVWDGLSSRESCWCDCEKGYSKVKSWFRHPEVGYDTRIECLADDCRQRCKDFGEAYVYVSGSSGDDCECGCAEGYTDAYTPGFCSSIDDYMTFPNDEGWCHESTYPSTYGVLESVCYCLPGRGNCDRNRDNGCEVILQFNSRHCGACGVSCPPGRFCAMGFCLHNEFRDAVRNVGLDNSQTRELLSSIRGNTREDVGRYIERFNDLPQSLKDNYFEYLWGKTGDLFGEGTRKSKFFRAVGYYFDFVKKPGAHLEVREGIELMLSEGKIDAEQAEMIKNLDALIKATSVLSGKTGADALYPQGVVLDTANDMVIDEALRSAKYSHCLDVLIENMDAPDDSPEGQLLRECLDRQVSAGIFK